MTRRRPRRHRPPNPDSNPSPPLLRDLPPDERPSQRLLRSGGPSLSDPELLSIILGNGCREVCSLDLARQILEEVRGLVGLVGIQAETLQRRGIGEAKAASVLASLELARRLARAEIPDRELLDRPAEIARYLVLRYAVRDQEVMGALYLDARHRLIAETETLPRHVGPSRHRAPADPVRRPGRWGWPGSSCGTRTQVATRPRRRRTSGSPGGWRRPARSSG